MHLYICVCMLMHMLHRYKKQIWFGVETVNYSGLAGIIFTDCYKVGEVVISNESESKCQCD